MPEEMTQTAVTTAASSVSAETEGFSDSMTDEEAISEVAARAVSEAMENVGVTSVQESEAVSDSEMMLNQIRFWAYISHLLYSLIKQKSRRILKIKYPAAKAVNIHQGNDVPTSFVRLLVLYSYYFPHFLRKILLLSNFD